MLLLSYDAGFCPRLAACGERNGCQNSTASLEFRPEMCRERAKKAALIPVHWDESRKSLLRGATQIQETGKYPRRLSFAASWYGEGAVGVSAPARPLSFVRLCTKRSQLCASLCKAGDRITAAASTRWMHLWASAGRRAGEESLLLYARGGKKVKPGAGKSLRQWAWSGD